MQVSPILSKYGNRAHNVFLTLCLLQLLGWIPCKLRKNGTEQLMNFTRGTSSSCFSVKASLDEQQSHAEPTYGFPQSMQPDRKCQRFSNEKNVNGVELISEEEPSYELFHGFLAIGTLGSEPLTTEPPTPTFPMPSQNGTNKEAEVTENELKLINNELEKFLEAEAKEIPDESSARSSYASIITFNNKQLDDADEEGWRYSATCPLQEYLFGSSIEVPETDVGKKKEKASLEELFRRNDAIHKDTTEKYDKMEKQAKHSNTTQFMKKMLKTLHLTARSTATASSAKAAESVATKRKLPKVLRFFHRKVHPEGLIAEKQFPAAEKNKVRRVSGEQSARNKGDREKKRSPKTADLKKQITPSELFSRRVKSKAIEANGEHWIKTDADYLVLEL